MAQLTAYTSGKEVIRQPIWCTLTMPIAGVTSIPFFSTPQGGSQTVGVTSISMTPARTNMKRANAIESPNEFILKAIRLEVIPTVDFTYAISNDKHLILKDGYMKIVIGSKEYLTIPLSLISSGSGLSGFVGVLAAGTERMYVTNNHPYLYKVEPWIVLPSDLNFSVTLNWDTAPNTSAVSEIKVVLDGDSVRPVQ